MSRAWKVKRYLSIIILLSLIKFSVQWVGNQNYGFHRDELLHLSVSEHLAWGYFEFPPLIAWLGKISYWFFDYSLWGVRLLPTLAGLGILLLCCLMARDLGGKTKAIFLAGVCTLAFLPFYRNHTLFQPVAFDQLFWTWGFYLLIRYINTQKTNYLLWLGLIFGLGLLNKYTIALWAIGVGVGLCLCFYERGKLYRNKWLYLGGLLAFLVVLPNVVWQYQHDFPFLLHLQVLKAKQLDHISWWAFGREQLDFPLTLAVSILGLVAFFRDRELKKYRSIGVAVTTTFVVMWLLQSKSYYLFAIYPVLFAGGAVQLEKLLHKRPVLLYAAAFILLASAAPFIPYATPILPIEAFVKYAGQKEVEGRVELTGDYADMFGWEEQVKLVDSLYQTLSEEEKNNCVIWAENYGEAGALKILGKKYGLPDPISRHGSFWLWGYGNKDASVWISLGNETNSVEYVFAETELIRIITHKYAIGEENGIPLYQCRKSKVAIEKWWSDYEKRVFD